MYLRAPHAEVDIPSLRTFIRDNPLGLFITAFASPKSPTIQCTHVPWVLDVSDESSPTELGKLRAHLARANPHSKALVEAVAVHGSANGTLEQEVSVVFTSNVHAYVTPKFYTETKPSTGKVVPTWNYAAVQAYGKVRVFGDARSPETSSYLQQQVQDLSKHSEEHLMKYVGGDAPAAWQVDDAPAPYVDILKKAIIGIEIDVDRLEGKWKMSQEMTRGDRDGVVRGFEALGTEHGHQMSKTVEERGALKDAKALAAAAAKANGE
ncbi:transcriptional regulator PAI 2-type [Durotheca rogersii]|uniref:transcriptional regulator PAI 2-type n=1 Tax=Durotheca rogersii TaxID=419775 RepID=UPI00221EA7D4|nr:transcriptional regulator PAI 2-type [Durotheca rogersii]KAI5865701.1 transcriptional regulator PAI 2-type [Durotheca rogersii]